MRRNILKDNRGLTLVEMLVSFAILSVVMVALFQFMTMMTKQYQTSNNEVTVQNEAQTLVQQLENFIIDADMGVELDETSGYKLYVMSSDGFCIISYIGTSGTTEVNELYYTDYTGIWDEDSGITKDNVFEKAQAYEAANTKTANLLAEYVSTFKVKDLEDTIKLDSNYVAIEITIQKLSRSYTVNKNIYLRNQIVTPSPTATPSVSPTGTT